MPIKLDLNTILSGIIILLVVWALKGLSYLNAHMAELNGSIRELKVWEVQHSKLDDERFRDAEQSLRIMWDRIHEKTHEK